MIWGANGLVLPDAADVAATWPTITWSPSSSSSVVISVTLPSLRPARTRMGVGMPSRSTQTREEDLAAGSETTLRAGPRIPGVLITAGDVSADGHTVALRTYGSMSIWARHGREPLTQTLARASCTGPRRLIVEGQGESLALSRGGTAAYTVPEGTSPLIRRYRAPSG